MLANLNRNDGGQAGKNSGSDLDARDDEELGEDENPLAQDSGAGGQGRNRPKLPTKAAGPTLESNLGTQPLLSSIS